MPSIRAKILNAYIRRKLRPLPMVDMEIGKLRAIMETRPIEALPRDVAVEVIGDRRAGGVWGEWARPAETDGRRTILYLHGGGYAFGSPRSYRAVTTRLAKYARAPVFSAGYRRAPEHTAPAPIEDALAAWDWLVAGGAQPASMVVGGDSAGGGLSLALVQALAVRGSALPAGLFLWSPYLDLTGSSPSWRDNADSDVLFQEDNLRRAGPRYAGDLPLDDPRVSPLYGDCAGLPPMQVYVSNDEMLRDDGLRLVEKARAQGVSVDLIREDGLVHVWPIFPPLAPEATRDLKKTAAFIRGVGA